MDEIKSAIFKLLISTNKNSTITAGTIALLIRTKFSLERFSDAKVRYIINEFRREEIPVLATSRGYYISYDTEDIEKQIVSSSLRIQAQVLALTGLRNLLQNIKNDSK